jgi:hypothetical protein
VITLLTFRNLLDRPWRSAFLFLGYGIGVGVMIVLLAIGDALITQARDERLIGGGEITVLPEGIDVEVMKTGGIGGLFFSIDHSRFVYRQLLASPRLASAVRGAAPQVVDKVLYLRGQDGQDYSVRASGSIPSRDRVVGAPPTIEQGTWVDDESDRRWMTPTPFELRNEIDHFHAPPASATNLDTWAEWHYFNVLSPDRKRWAFISFILGGDPRGDRWGGKVTVTLREQGKQVRKFAALAGPREVRFSTTDANLQIGQSTVTVMPDGRYAIRALAREEKGSRSVRIDLVIAPAPNAYFPGAELGSGTFISGYVVPGLRASGTGTICVDGACESYEEAQAYHDHNWGVWENVTWDWGSARAGEYTVLYGRVIAPDSTITRSPLFVYIVDSLGFVAVFRPRDIEYAGDSLTRFGGTTMYVPTRAVFRDARGDDSIRVELTVEDAIATDLRSPNSNAPSGMGTVRKPFFVQMKGTMRLHGRVGGRSFSGVGSGFFETYR